MMYKVETVTGDQFIVDEDNPRMAKRHVEAYCGDKATECEPIYDVIQIRG